VDFADVCTVMKNGGVAILGSAACEGEDRAQRAIEEALNSPLLNDNDIRGAKWILININSCEGEHEFTMDEVEIIQSHLLSQAGENTDVILGLGYDNSLGSKLGITLIATGFEHKDPFVKKVAIKQQPQEEKIVMTLGKQPAPTPSPLAEQKMEDAMAPTLIDETNDSQIPLFIAEKEEPLQAEFFELGEPQIKAEEKEEEATVSIQLKFKEEEKAESEREKEKKELERQKQALEDKFEALRQNILGGQNTSANQTASSSSAASGGYLARPSNIYAETKKDLSTSKPADEPVASANAKPEEDSFDMQLVIRNEVSSEEVPPVTGNPVPAPTAEAGEPKVDQVQGDEKQRATERLQKLRNLSFNLNAADPNNEF
jgi:cell division protein FtsZ